MNLLLRVALTAVHDLRIGPVSLLGAVTLVLLAVPLPAAHVRVRPRRLLAAGLCSFFFGLGLAGWVFLLAGMDLHERDDAQHAFLCFIGTSILVWRFFGTRLTEVWMADRLRRDPRGRRVLRRASYGRWFLRPFRLMRQLAFAPGPLLERVLEESLRRRHEECADALRTFASDAALDRCHGRLADATLAWVEGVGMFVPDAFSPERGDRGRLVLEAVATLQKACDVRGVPDRVDAIFDELGRHLPAPDERLEPAAPACRWLSTVLNAKVHFPADLYSAQVARDVMPTISEAAGTALDLLARFRITRVLLADDYAGWALETVLGECLRVNAAITDPASLPQALLWLRHRALAALAEVMEPSDGAEATALHGELVESLTDARVPTTAALSRGAGPSSDGGSN